MTLVYLILTLCHPGMPPPGRRCDSPRRLLLDTLHADVAAANRVANAWATAMGAITGVGLAPAGLPMLERMRGVGAPAGNPDDPGRNLSRMMGALL